MPDYDELLKKLEERLDAEARERQELLEELRESRNPKEVEPEPFGLDRLRTAKRKEGYPNDDN
jgi:hypothetical protein